MSQAEAAFDPFVARRCAAWPHRQEARMPAAADWLHAVASLHLKGHRAPAQLGYRDGDFDRHTQQGRGDVVEFDPRAHRVLALVKVRQQEVATGHLDVVQQLGGGIHARFFTHEADRAITIHRQLRCQSDAGLQRWFHEWSPLK
jgi:hypothetical protein